MTDDKPKILIVDDERANLTGFKYMFDDIYDIYIAESAAKGHEVLSNNEIQVVISDQRMPNITGVEFLKQVLREHPDTVRMILTGYSDFEAIVEAVNKGQIYYYFSKPWNESEMRMIIDNAIEANRLKMRIQENEVLFKQLSENVKEVFWIYSKNWEEIFFVSPAYDLIWEQPRKTLYQNPKLWLESIHPKDRPTIEKLVSRHDELVTDDFVFPDFRVQSSSGSIRWISFKVFPIYNKKGIIFRYAGISEDFTEKKHAMEMMVQSEKIISLGGLAAGMAHELNNPLAGIINGAQIIEQRFLTHLKANRKVAEKIGVDLERMNRYMEERNITTKIEGIKECGNRSVKIISDMLAFGRKNESSKKRSDISKVVENIIEIAKSDYDLKKNYQFDKVKIKVDFEKTLPKIPCNETEIGQVILNLIKNAVQAISTVDDLQDPKIGIRLGTEDGYLNIEIEDNGPGMEESIRNHIFEPFFTTKIKGVGTGLGLSISYHIITVNHKGTIGVDSIPGKGTTFTIKLPI